MANRWSINQGDTFASSHKNSNFVKIEEGAGQPRIICEKTYLT